MTPVAGVVAQRPAATTLREAGPLPRPWRKLPLDAAPAPPRALLARARGCGDAPRARRARGRRDSRSGATSTRGRPRPARRRRGERARDALRERLGRFGLVATTAHRHAARRRASSTASSPARAGATAPPSRSTTSATTPASFGLDGGDVDGLRLVDRDVRRRGRAPRVGAALPRHPVADTQLAGRGHRRRPAADRDRAARRRPRGPRRSSPRVSAERAYAAARRAAATRPGAAVRAARRRRRAGDDVRATAARASLALYQDGDGARLAWRVLAPVSSTEVYDALVDAAQRRGRAPREPRRLRRRRPRSSGQPARRARRRRHARTRGWLDAGATRLKGPYAHAFADSDGSRASFGEPTPPLEAGATSRRRRDGKLDVPALARRELPERATAARPRAVHVEPRDAGLVGRQPEQSATQLFYLVNTFHDHLARCRRSASSTAARQLRQPANPSSRRRWTAPTSTARTGRLPDADHVNNASFLTLPDGKPGLLQAHLFAKPTPFGDYDGATTPSLVFHEYTHGLATAS